MQPNKGLISPSEPENRPPPPPCKLEELARFKAPLTFFPPSGEGADWGGGVEDEEDRWEDFIWTNASKLCR